MAASVEVKVGERTFTVRELTVAEVRDWAVRVESGLLPVDPVGALMSPDWSLADLVEMSSATAEDMEAMTFAEVSSIAEAARKLNPHFFSLRAALMDVARRVAEKALHGTSSAASAD